MNKTINVLVKQKSWPNPYGVYTIETNSTNCDELEVNQRCIDRIHELVEGKWDVEFDSGIIILYGSYPRSKPPKLCQSCGTRIPYHRTWCDECLLEHSNGMLAW
jgi:hypothetical protein